MFRLKKPVDGMTQVRKQLKTQTNALSLFLQSAGIIALGMIMLLNDSFFIKRTSELIFLYFLFIAGMSFIRTLLAFGEGARAMLRQFLSFLAACFAVNVLWQNIDNLFGIIPIALSLWLMLMSLSSFISFMQYYGEKDVRAYRFLMSAVANVVFAMLFIVRTDNPLSASIRILGIHSILLGLSSLFDFFSVVIPVRYVNRFKHRVRLAPPVFTTLMLPQHLLDSVNAFFLENEEQLPEFKVESLPMEFTEADVAVEVLIHVSKSLSGTAGHVDIALGDTVYCYGAYDKAQSKKYGGVAGDGVVYEVSGKAGYIEFCKTLNKETLFGFELTLTEDELAQIRQKLEEMKARSYLWRCPSQQARAEGRATDGYQDFPSRMANAIPHAMFYKFTEGNYKHYWILGTNCVTFVDDLLRLTRLKKLVTVINTPGTYYDFLNAEFLKQGTIVVKREVYNKAIGVSVRE